MRSRHAFAAAALLTLLSGLASAAPVNFRGYSFNAFVQKGNGARYREFIQGGQPTLKVRPDEEYSIVVQNPLPVRVAVAVSIDGLNSIDGQRTSPRNARKWMIEPHGTLTVAGWQTGGQTLRKFLFARQDAAYAQWKEGKDGKPYTQNLGVIGVAWFWNTGELETALHPPQPFSDDMVLHKKNFRRMEAPAAAPAMAEGKAGTGMGREEQNAVTEVKFSADAGMFSVGDVLKIFYEFAKEPTEPQPFVSEGEENDRFAPDMYK